MEGDFQSKRDGRRESKRMYFFAVLVIMGVVMGIFILLNVRVPGAENTGIEKSYAMLLAESQKKASRPQYFSSEVMDSVYGDLNRSYAFPADFYATKFLYTTNTIEYDPVSINDAYWKQPEWWARYEESVVPLMRNYDPERNLVMWCIFAYPTTHIIEIEQKSNASGGEDIYEFYNWIKSMDLATERFGGKIVPVIPQSAEFKGQTYIKFPNFTVEQDPREVAKYVNFTVEYREDDHSAWKDAGNIVLDPNFPKYLFNYTLQIRLTAKIKSGMPEGKYVVGYDITPPDKDFSDKMYKTYKMSYADPVGGRISCGGKTFRLFIIVK